ncbi:hypothetical protein BDV95DRAFT_48992 [Massariosphaeria phaeospora]|uniref:Uncharacterized protein n=1 Tax=Massariosphaeria phaeospora TaxID=100035 RepID=A0A7C8I9Q7_9PLEO|nr:hypothetical protein BDV95DRAFT_48992 [Massariosphaeria phaeospora]
MRAYRYVILLLVSCLALVNGAPQEEEQTDLELPETEVDPEVCVEDKCMGNMAPNEAGECETCPKGTKPNVGNTVCVEDKCMGNMAPNEAGECETCPKGTKPNVGNTVCVDKGPDNQKKRGKCKDEGYILDPAEGGQDENTENPVCTLDDSKKCEDKSRTPVTRRPKNKVEPKDAETYTPECAKDEDPNYRCKNHKRTYHHMESETRGEDDKVMKHSCRTTRYTKKELVENYQKRVETAKEQKKRTTESKKAEQKENNRRGRNGFCFALLVGIGTWDLKEVAAMSPDEVDGMMETWPENDADPEFLDDHMVTIGYKPKTAVGGISETTMAGPPIVMIIKGIIKLFQIFKKATPRAAPPSTRKAFYTELKGAGSRPKAPPKSLEAAKKSGTVGKMIKDQRFLDCLAAAPALAVKARGRHKPADPPRSIDVNDYRVVIDWNAPRNALKIPGEEFEDRQITVRLGADTDNKVTKNGGATDWASTYPDRIPRPGRLLYEDCQTIPDNLKNKVTAVETWGGCCSFYADNDCKESSYMFSMMDREDWKLDGKHNDNMEAVWCTFEAKCKGAPGARM